MAQPRTGKNQKTFFADQVIRSSGARVQVAALGTESESIHQSSLTLPAVYSMVEELDFLTEPERRLYKRIEGRTFINMYALLQRYTDIAMGEQGVPRDVALSMEAQLPAGYQFTPDVTAVDSIMSGFSNWALRGLALALYQMDSVFRHMTSLPEPIAMEIWNGWFALPANESESRKSLLIKSWAAEDGKLESAAQERAVDDLINLVAVIDGLLKTQARQDSRFFAAHCFREFNFAELGFIEQIFLNATRYQLITTGTQSQQFAEVVHELTTPAQKARLRAALLPIVANQAH